MSAQAHLSGNESWLSLRIPILFLLSVSLGFISVPGKPGGGKMYLKSNKTFSFAKREGFHLCLSIRIISISKVGCDFEMKIETIPSPKAEVGCFDRPFLFFSIFFFFLPLGSCCLESIVVSSAFDRQQLFTS